MIDQADLLGDLDNPFRDQQFHGVIIDTQQTAMSDPRHAEQIYRVLHERAPLIDPYAGNFGMYPPFVRFVSATSLVERRALCHRYQIPANATAHAMANPEIRGIHRRSLVRDDARVSV